MFPATKHEDVQEVLTLSRLTGRVLCAQINFGGNRVYQEFGSIEESQSKSSSQATENY